MKILYGLIILFGILVIVSITGIYYKNNIPVIKEPGADFVEMKNFTITAYCPCKICNGKWVGKLATGDNMYTMMKGRNIIAVDPKVIPLGSIIFWNKKYYFALDTGGKIKRKRLDVLLKTHKKAMKFGVKYKQTIWVLK